MGSGFSAKPASAMMEQEPEASALEDDNRHTSGTDAGAETQTGEESPAAPASSHSGSELSDDHAADHSSANHSKAFTPKKGRPTPKRNEQERKAGVRHDPVKAPETAAEARKRRKELKNSMSKEEYKAYKQRQRDEAARERRRINDRMMAGDENYLLDRDKGPERRFVRNWVDSHRYIMNLFLPLTVVALIIMVIGVKNPSVANIASLFMMAVIIVMMVEGFMLSRRVNAEVRKRFPDTALSKRSVGFYAFTRATMIRRMRTPAPQVQVGQEFSAPSASSHR